MNEHTQRILLRINEEIASFIQGKIDEKSLIRHIEAHSGGIEDEAVKKKLASMVATIEELLYTRDREVIKKTVGSFREGFVDNDSFEKLFSGKVLYNELDLLNESLPLQQQLDVLKEDLLQVENKDGSLLLDVGWYPEFDLSGSFGIQVIKKHDWEKPLYSKNASNVSSLKTAIKECALLYNF